MARKKEYSSLPRNLSNSIREFSRVFGVDSLGVKAQEFVERIRKDNTRPTELLVEAHSGLVWLKEGGERCLVFWGSKDRDRFSEWLKQPATRLLQQRGIKLKLAPYAASARDVLLSAEEEGVSG